jgi:polyisoprenoid-binding protein YceI
MTTVSSPTTTEIPGYVAGTWTIDTVHSDVSFTARHMMVSKVRGHFETFSGTVVTGENPLDSSVNAVIEVGSVNTRQEYRDNHLRTSDFFDVENHPQMTFRSTGVRRSGDGFEVDGELTLRGVTKAIVLDLELNGFQADGKGGHRIGFSGRTEINRHDFGVSWNAALEGGGFTLGDKVQIILEIEAILDQS